MCEGVNHRYFAVCTCIGLLVVGLLCIHGIRRPSLLSSLALPLASSTQPTHEITLVTAYYPLAKAKHSPSEYLSWLENFLAFCQSPMIIFTSPRFRPVLHQLRRNSSSPSVFIVDYASPLHIPLIRPLIATFTKQLPGDPQGGAHSIDLYAIWCAKSFLLNRSTELNPFQSRFFVYVDAGAFRSADYRFRLWPDVPTLTSVLHADRLFLGMIAPLPARFCPLRHTISDGPIRLDILEGGVIGGSVSVIRWWTSVFYETVYAYGRKDFFIGKDESVMNAIGIVHASRFSMLLSFRTDCGNPWFAFEPLLARKNETERLPFSSACRQQNLSQVVIPFETICGDARNLVEDTFEQQRR